MKPKFLAILLFALFAVFPNVKSAFLFVETESFSCKGGWVVDQQFMDVMGSPYLLAHGMGEPVKDASTQVEFPEKAHIMCMYVPITGLRRGKKAKEQVSSACMWMEKR